MVFLRLHAVSKNIITSLNSFSHRRPNNVLARLTEKSCWELAELKQKGKRRGSRTHRYIDARGSKVTCLRWAGVFLPTRIFPRDNLHVYALERVKRYIVYGKVEEKIHRDKKNLLHMERYSWFLIRLESHS